MIFNAGPGLSSPLIFWASIERAVHYPSQERWCVAQTRIERFIELFRQRKNYSALYRDSEPLEDSHLAQIYRVGYAELNRLGKSLETKNLLELSTNPETLIENVDRAIQGGMTSERQRLERFLPLLAPRHTAPFIGLFGRSGGIHDELQEMAQRPANLA